MHTSKYLWFRPKSCGITNFLGYVSLHNPFATSVEIDAGLLTKPNKRTAASKTKGTSTKNMKSEKKNHSKDILDYFVTNNSLDIMNDLPKKIVERKRKSPDALYIVDRDVAQQLVTALKPHLLRGNCPIFEVNPGSGLVSEELIRAGAPHLYLYEPNISFNSGPQLQKLKTKYPNQVDVSTADLFQLHKLTFQDKMDGGSRLEDIMRGVSRKPWTDDPAVKIIGALTNAIFLKHLIISFVFQNGIMMYGRPELYLVMPPPLFIHLSCDNTSGYQQYRSTTVLFQLLFRLEMLAKLPRKAYLPWEADHPVTIRNNLAKVRSVDPEYLYLVKIESREDFFKNVVPADKLQALWYFVQQNLVSRKNQVIPQLEKWIPGCGPRLILGGLNIFTQFGDLTPREILAVFREFSGWPEYPHSPFLPSMETSFLKMETVPEDLDKEEVDEQVAEEQEGIEEDEIGPTH